MYSWTDLFSTSSGIFKIATRKSPVITRSHSRALKYYENVSFYPELSERFAIIPSSDATNLGVQLSEMLNKFNELSAEMAAQKRMINQLVSNNTGGVQNGHIPIDDNQHKLKNPPPHMSYN